MVIFPNYSGFRAGLINCTNTACLWMQFVCVDQQRMPETFPAATWERISLLAAGKQHFAPSQDPADHSSPKQSCFLALNGNIRTIGMRRKLGEVSFQKKLPFSISFSCCWRAVGGECSQGLLQLDFSRWLKSCAWRWGRAGPGSSLRLFSAAADTGFAQAQIWGWFLDQLGTDCSMHWNPWCHHEIK